MRLVRLAGLTYGLIAASVLIAASSIWSTARAQAQAQINIAYGDVTTTDPAIAHARADLMNAHALEELQQFFAPLRLPTDLNIRADLCGAQRRAYDSTTKTVTICYDMIAQILAVANAQASASAQERTTAILGTVVEALFHESAYALFDLYNVPIWGRIDDAADRLSALAMLQFGEDNARTTILGTADFFLWSARTWTGSDFASAQSPEAQRFYNFLCIAYGGDPITFYNLAANNVLPQYRAQQCPREYAQIRAAFDLRLMPYIDPDLLVKARARKW